VTRAGLVAALAALVAGPLAAQAPATLSGTVLRAESGDTVPVPGIRVVLHQVGIATQGPRDSTGTGPRGEFRFRFQPDSTANYLLSARFAGIEYFSVPLKPRPGLEDSVTLVVFDTSSTAPVGTMSRTFVVGAPETDGQRTVIDWLVLANPGTVTRVGPDSLAATWGAALPRDSRNPSVGDPRLTQFSPEAVTFTGDSVHVTAPLSPGRKELVLQYELPRGRDLEVAVAGIDSVDVYLEDRSARVEGSNWVRADTQNFQGRIFQRYVRQGAVPDLVVDFPGLDLPTGPTLAALVGLVLVGLGVVTVLGLKRRPRPVPAAAGPATTALADRIARLDEDFKALATPDAEATARYQREREGLMAELRAALAARGSRS
jgi:hypothetical protein